MELPENARDPVRLTSGRLWLEDGLVRFRYEVPAVNRLDASEIVAAIRELVGDRNVPTVVDMRSVRHSDYETRRFFSDRFPDLVTALVVAPGPSRTMAELYVRLTQPERPVEIFTSEEEAVEWAAGFLAPAGAGGVIRTPIGRMWIDGGVVYHAVERTEFTTEDARRLFEIVAEATGGRTLPAVVDIRGISDLDPPTRSLLAAGGVHSVEALIVDTGPSRSVADVFITLDGPDHPVRAFESREAAESWARTFLPDEE